MDFASDDPGAVRFGNFINYYQFNSAEKRLELLPLKDEIWVPVDSTESQPYLVLDVGCNAGTFTQLLWEFLTKLTGRKVIILGVDIDSTLIERAVIENLHPDSISYTCLDVMDSTARQHLSGFLDTHGCAKFDVVCCFSITMWIHLNHHDNGLREFLQMNADMAKLFVVEPQPWKCYQTAQRRLRKANIKSGFPLFHELQWRSNVEQEIQNFLEKQLGRQKVHECLPTQWNRRICFYR